MKDFRSIIGDDSTAEESGGRVSNPSLDAYTTEYLRRHNLKTGRRDRPLARKLTRISDGPDLRVSPTDLLEFHKQFQASNDALVHDFFSAEDAHAFLAPLEPGSGLAQEEITDTDMERVESRLRELPQENAKPV